MKISTRYFLACKKRGVNENKMEYKKLMKTEKGVHDKLEEQEEY